MRTTGEEAPADGSGKEVFLDLTGVSVFVAMPTTRGLPAQTAISLVRAAHACWEKGIKFELLIEPGISDVCLARSVCAHRFLKSDTSVLFWVDSDLQFSADAFMRTLALTTKVDVAFGAYPLKSDPVCYMLSVDGPFLRNEYGCLKSMGGPMGFCAVNRRVMEALAAKSPLAKFTQGNLSEEPVRQIFHRGASEDGYVLSEDVMFFQDICYGGFEVWCDPSLVLGHIGDRVYEGSVWQSVSQEQQQPQTQELPPQLPRLSPQRV